MKPCCLFSYLTAAAASEHMQFDTIEVFKDEHDGGNDSKYPDDYLYGGKCTYLALVQCKNCGALFRECEREEILCMDDGICFFTTYYPVSSRDEALSFRLKASQRVWIEKMSWIGGVSWNWNNWRWGGDQ